MRQKPLAGLVLSAFPFAVLILSSSVASADASIVITSPAHGTFSLDGSTVVTGELSYTSEWEPTYGENQENPTASGWVKQDLRTGATEGSVYAKKYNEFPGIEECIGGMDRFSEDLSVHSFSIDANGEVSVSGWVNVTWSCVYGEFEDLRDLQSFPVKPEHVKLQEDQITIFATFVIPLDPVDMAPDPEDWALEVNGEPVSIDSDYTWTTETPLDPSTRINPIVARATVADRTIVDRTVVIAGESRADGEPSEQAIGAQVEIGRIGDKYVPILLDELDGSKFKTEVKHSGLTVKIDGTVNKVEWSGDVVVGVDKSDGITVSVGVTGLRADMDDFYASYLRSCSAYAVADFYAHLHLDKLRPDENGELIVGDAIEFEARNADFVFKNYSACYNRLTLPNGMPDTTGQTIASFLRAGFSDGAGDMLAEAIPALVGAELAALTVPIDLTELYETIQTEVVFEVSDASLSGSTVTVTADVGAMSMCVPPEGAPTLGASYHAAGGNQFPQSQLPDPWLLGASFSTSLANQVLKSQIECGLLQEDVEELDIFSNGTQYPTTLGFVSIVIGALTELTGSHGMNPLALVRIEILPTLAPIMTTDGGPNGEQFGLEVPHFLIRLVDTGSISNFPAEGATPTGEPEQLLLEAAVDFGLGVDVLTTDDEVSFEIGIPDSADITAVVTDNPFDLDAPAVEGVVPGLIGLFVPALVDALEAIPLPELLGEQVYLSDPFTSGEHVGVHATLGE